MKRESNLAINPSLWEKKIVFLKGLEPKEEDEKGEQLESALHSHPSFDEKDDNQPSVVMEECYNFFYEECNQLVTSSISGGFKEDFSPPVEEEQEDDQPNNVQEEGHTILFYEDYNQHVENSVSDVFIEDFSSLIYDEYEDGYLDHAPKEPAICNKKMDHQE